MVSEVNSCRYHLDWKNQCFWVTGAMSLKRSGIEDSYGIRRPFHGMSIRTYMIEGYEHVTSTVNKGGR